MRETIFAFITKVFHSTEGTYVLDVAEASASSAHNNRVNPAAVKTRWSEAKPNESAVFTRLGFNEMLGVPLLLKYCYVSSSLSLSLFSSSSSSNTSSLL